MLRMDILGTGARLAMLMSVLLLALPGLALAQGRGDPAAMQERIDAEIDQVIEELELNEDEAEVTRAILREGSQERIAVMREMRSSGGPPDRQAMREAMDEMDLTTEAMLAEFLSDDQMQAFREVREKRRTEARAQRGQGRGQGQGRRQGGGP